MFQTKISICTGKLQKKMSAAPRRTFDFSGRFGLKESPHGILGKNFYLHGALDKFGGVWELKNQTKKNICTIPQKINLQVRRRNSLGPWVNGIQGGASSQRSRTFRILR